MAKKVLVTREIPKAGLRLLEEFDTNVFSEEPPERDEFLKAAQGGGGSPFGSHREDGR